MITVPAAKNLATIRDLQEEVAKAFEITTERLLSRDNLWAARTARKVAMYLSWRLTRTSYAELGKPFGRSGYSVRDAVLSVERERSYNEPLQALLDRLECKFKPES